MRDDIKDLLKRYDEIGALILEQKLDEFGDQLDQKPEGVDDATYEEYIQRLAKEEGILCGISSGTNVCVAMKLARELGPGRRVVTILPDTGERYFSTPLFNHSVE